MLKYQPGDFSTYAINCLSSPHRMLTALRRTMFALLIAGLLPSKASATWSIVIRDPTTQRIGVAGASCTGYVYGIMGLLPGKGVLIAQAVSSDPATQQAMKLLDQGASLDSIWRVIGDPVFDQQLSIRQYGLATLRGEFFQYTGDRTPDYHGDRRAPNVLVQGNTLPGPEVLDRIMAAIRDAQTAQRSVEDVLMAGLQAGADAGGDRRCGEQRAMSSFLVVAGPDEPVGRPYLSIIVFGADSAGVNAVDFLHTKFSEWKASGGPKNRRSRMDYQPPAPALHVVSPKAGG
jgi:uncharacterized Ntn-hydrolase superfamily protein